jgi:PAS domain S-box-containing protein
VILLSARAGEESRVEGLGAGADDYLVKPFSARELLARVASHLNMARIRRDAAERETLLRAEADLERDRIRNLFAQTPAPLCLTSGPEHRFTFANREFVKVTGRRSAEEIIGKTVREAFPEIVSQGFADLLDQVYRTGIPHSGNETKVTFEPSGGAPRECYFNFIYQPIRGVDGNVDGILAHGVDVTEQVLARRAIQREEERLRLAQTAAHVGTWEWDATGNRSTLSPELYQIFGTNPQDPHHVETWMANLHPEDRDTVFRLMREGYESGEMDFEYRYRHPELGVRWLYCKGRRVRKESRMFGVVLDVTERKNMEDALRDSQRQFRDLAESVPQLVWMAEPNGDIFWYNRQWYEYTGTTPDEMRGWGWQSVHDPEVLPKVLDAWKHSLRTGERFEMVFPLRGADGKYRHFLTRVVPVRNAVGSIVRWFGTNTDVTAQRRAEEELRESQRRFRDMIDSLPAAVYTTDAEGRITHFNPAAVEFSGRTPEIGSDQWCVTWKIFTADGTPLPHEECPMAVALKEGRIIAGAECMAERPDGTRLWFTPYPQVFRDAQGRITGGINMLVDITERKRAEQAIRESEQRLRAIVETTPECVKLVRADGTVLHMNAAGLVMVGAESSSEVVGKSVYDLIASEDRDRFRRFNEAICRGEKASLEYDIVGLRGVRRRMETHAAPLPQADGSFVHLAVTRDVTEQAQAARVQTLLAAIVGSSDDAILSKDLDGFITSWNKGAEEIFGYSAQEAIGSHITMIVPPDRIDEENEILARIRRGERVEHSETVRRRKDDMLLDVSLTISPLKDGTGRIIGASTVARDISDRKRAERALRESEQRFRVITEASPVMVWMSGVDKLCYYFNKGWLDFVGRTLEQEAGNGWAENVHPDDFDRCLQIYVTSFDARRPFQMEYRLRHHTGEYRWILDCGVPRFAPDGTFEGYMGGCLDIHDQKCTTEALRQSEERLRALSETLESEVAARTRELEKRNAEVLKQSEQLRELSWQLLRTQDEERRHIARELHDSAGQILAVLSMSITTLLESTKQQAPDLAQSVEQADRLLQQLSREIRTTSYLLHPPLLDEMGLDGALSWYIDGLRQRSGLQIELNVSEDFGRLPGDMELVVFRMVQESLTNIHRHSGSKTASIQVVREPGKVSIEIRDKGKGIPAEKLVEIQTKGSGVGIRGMRERLRQFQGELTVESSGQGTTLRVIIPVQPETPAVPQPPGAAALAGPILQPGAPAPRRAASTNAD